MPGDKVKIDSPFGQTETSHPPARRFIRGLHSRPHASPQGDLAPTADYPPAAAAAPGAEPRKERGGLGGNRTQPLTEARDLLAARLDAAVQLLLLFLGALLVRGVWLGDRGPAILLASAWVLVALAVIHLWLANDRTLTVFQLRAVELFVFGLVTILLATSQYRLMLQRYQQDNATLVLAAMKSSVLLTLVLLTTYGIFIPNDWKRAAVVVAPIALAPASVAWLLLTFNPGLATVAARVASLEQSSDHTLMLGFGALLAVFGAQIVGALCARVSEAHHLGPYHLGEQLGVGGMGEVYLAEHQFLKRPCAIKLIRPGKATDPRALARFEREVRTTAQLSHWNTVEVYDYGRTEDGTFFYVMEYLPGLSLDELVDRHGPLSPERVIHLLRQACAALHEAHGLGLIHRDLKPANIFAAHRGGLHDVTKLLDFGLAKRHAETPSMQLSHHGSITGSPLFMSPEQATGQRADPRSDLYSLGAVAYYLLTGHAPFRGEHALTVMIAHARDAAPPPTKFRPDLPADLERIVLRCLAKNPADRYQDAASLDEALTGCAAANLWTEARAAAWWKSVEAAASTQAIAAPQSVGYAC